MLSSLDSLSRSPLYIAAQMGRYDILRFFLTQTFRKKGDINERHRDGSTPLLVACWNGHLECVKLLLKKGGAISGAMELPNNKGLRPLHAAAMSGSLPLVDHLVLKADPPAELNTVDKCNRSAFFIAAQEGNLELVKQMSLYEDIDMKIGYAFSYTGQEFALTKGNKEVGFYIRDLLREWAIAEKEKEEAAINDNDRKNREKREKVKKKTLLTEDEWVIANAFAKGGRNLFQLDTVPFKSFDHPKQDWVKKEHEIKEMRSREKQAKLDRARKAQELEEDLQEQRENNGGLTDDEVKAEAYAKANRKLTVSERRKNAEEAARYSAA